MTARQQAKFSFTDSICPLAKIEIGRWRSGLPIFCFAIDHAPGQMSESVWAPASVCSSSTQAVHRCRPQLGSSPNFLRRKWAKR